MAEVSCGEARALAAEFALGILSGADRAGVISHLDACSDCREVVREYAEVAEGVVALAPASEPPAGLEERVLGRLGPPAPRLSRRGLAAAVVAASLGFAGYAAGRWVDRVPATPEVLATAPLLATDGRRSVGRVFLYTGSPSWLHVAMDADGATGLIDCELRLRDGTTVGVGSFRTVGGYGSWAVPIRVSAASVTGVRLRGPDGSVIADATLDG